MSITIKRTLCLDGTVENSDSSYSGTVASGGSLSIPDSQINVNGNDEGDVVSVQTIDVNVTDGTNPVTPTDISLVGNTLTIEVPTGGSPLQGAMPLKTGQTTSFVAFDDGAQEMGRLTDFLTLDYDNPFGNAKRFTDKTDAGTFANSVAYDWSTWNETTGKVLAYYFGDTGFRNLTDQCALHVASTIDGLANNWYLWNVNQCENILLKEQIGAFMLNYAPFNTSSRYFWISSNPIGAGGVATDLAALGWLISVSKSNTYLGIWVRECTVTGTTIT